MRVLWLGLAAVLSSGRPVPGAADTVPAQSEPSLSGTWTFGTPGQAEPQAKVIEVPPRCGNAGVTMSVVQHGDEVTARLEWLPVVGGARPAFAFAEFEQLSGTLQGKQLVLHGEHVVQARELGNDPGRAPPPDKREAVEYRLHLNARGHLVGLRTQGNAAVQPFWAAPAKPASGPAHCGPPRP